MITQDQLVGYLKAAKSSDIRSLITSLEDELGVVAAVPQMYFQQPQEPPPEPEQTEFDLVLTSFGAKKILVIKAIRVMTGFPLKKSKTLAEETPSVIREGISREDAERLGADLVDAGGTIELR